MIVAAAGLAAPWVLAATPAGAEPSLSAPDHIDHHQRPPQYDDPTLAVPPSSGAVPDYPLAVGFTPADPSNYTANGIVSYDYVVVHTMQGYYAGSISWFQNPSANVSAHYVMRSDDGEVTQMVRDVDRAWHVGNSNSYALGIEHEGFVQEEGWYTWATYRSSALLTRWLCSQHGIPVDRDHIVGHVELPNQTHTDPGPLWDWELYMALVRDVVPPGEVHGVVVDRSAACTMTASADTWIKATLEDAADLADGDRCSIPAGSSVTVLHASDPMIGHARLTFEEGGTPCAGALASEGFAWLDDFEGACSAESMAATGAIVSLDGGDPLEVDAAGRFVFGGVSPGGHTVDATAEGFVDGSGAVELAVHPGGRVVIVLDPVPDAGDTGGVDTGSSDASSDGGGDDLPGGTGGDGLPGDGDGIGDGTDSDGGQDTRALPPGFGEGEDTGCSCRQRRSGSGLAWAVPWLLLTIAQRRRRVRI